MSSSPDNIIWIDMEMTGLDPDQDHVMEVACIVSDKNLVPISEELKIVIHHDDNILRTMNEWCQKHHAESGLLEECRASNISISSAEDMLMKFLKGKVPQGRCPLAGSTVYMDKLFMMKHFPRVIKYVHYRIIDVSSFKEIIRRWFPDFPEFKKQLIHRALPDIRESIEELKYFRKYILKPNTTKSDEKLLMEDVKNDIN